MSTEKMRESFEAWHQIEYPGATLARRRDGEYINLYVGMCWIGWQASRAAIEVELSILAVTNDTDTNHEPCGDDLFYADEVKTLIESLGLKVKP